MAMGIGALINGAETAKRQGVNLYGEQQARIVAAMELNAGFVYSAVKNGQNPPSGWPCTSSLNTTAGAWKVTWEIGYNEFANRRGISMPNTSRLLNDVVRPSSWRTTVHMDYETLTNYSVP